MTSISFQSDIRTISVSHCGSELGLQVLKGLSKLYTSLVWESTVLLAFCSEDILPPNCEFGRTDLEKIIPKDLKENKNSETKESKTKLPEGDVGSPRPAELKRHHGEMGSNGVSAAMETLSTSETTSTPMDTEDPVVQNTSEASSDETTKDKDSNVTDDKKKSKMSPAMQVSVLCFIKDLNRDDAAL